jgi:hypothetical protein
VYASFPAGSSSAITFVDGRTGPSRPTPFTLAARARLRAAATLVRKSSRVATAAAGGGPQRLMRTGVLLVLVDKDDDLPLALSDPEFRLKVRIAAEKPQEDVDLDHRSHEAHSGNRCRRFECVAEPDEERPCSVPKREYGSQVVTLARHDGLQMSRQLLEFVLCLSKVVRWHRQAR